MGEVWRAYDERLDRHVAVRLISTALQATRKPAEELAARFSRECRALARIDHPGVVAIHDAGRDPDLDGGELYLVMQRIDGMGLADFVAESEQIPWWQAAALGAQVATILAAVHAIPVVHRDRATSCCARTAPWSYWTWASQQSSILISVGSHEPVSRSAAPDTWLRNRRRRASRVRTATSTRWAASCTKC
jgi:hypothetical protein